MASLVTRFDAKFLLDGVEVLPVLDRAVKAANLDMRDPLIATFAGWLFENFHLYSFGWCRVIDYLYTFRASHPQENREPGHEH